LNKPHAKAHQRTDTKQSAEKCALTNISDDRHACDRREQRRKPRIHPPLHTGRTVVGRSLEEGGERAVRRALLRVVRVGVAAHRIVFQTHRRADAIGKPHSAVGARVDVVVNVDPVLEAYGAVSVDEREELTRNVLVVVRGNRAIARRARDVRLLLQLRVGSDGVGGFGAAAGGELVRVWRSKNVVVDCDRGEGYSLLAGDGEAAEMGGVSVRVWVWVWMWVWVWVWVWAWVSV
jgi:hypothetical protein